MSESPQKPHETRTHGPYIIEPVLFCWQARCRDCGWSVLLPGPTLDDNERTILQDHQLKHGRSLQKDAITAGFNFRTAPSGPEATCNACNWTLAISAPFLKDDEEHALVAHLKYHHVATATAPVASSSAAVP